MKSKIDPVGLPIVAKPGCYDFKVPSHRIGGRRFHGSQFQDITELGPLIEFYL